MSDESNFFRRIGIPASLAALVSAAVTMSFFMFQIDNRYAKTDDVAALNSRTIQKIDALTTEVSRLAGVTQVLIQVAGRMEAVQSPAPVSVPSITPVMPIEAPAEAASSPTEAVSVDERPAALQDVLETAAIPLVSPTTIQQADIAVLQETLRQTGDTLQLSRRNLDQIQKF